MTNKKKTALVAGTTKTEADERQIIELMYSLAKYTGFVKPALPGGDENVHVL